MLTKRVLLAAAGVGALVILAQGQRAEARIKAEPVEGQLMILSSAQAPDCCAPRPVCCPPCITYRHRGPKLCCGCCEPGTPTVLSVKNPCTGCPVEVSVCLPACCTGEPKVCCGTGFLCRDVVDYEWCCGYSVRVAFKHCGDVLVTTWGR
ncbi:MAG TPA: hypothetical protein VGZ26_07780 [Pirellulales bacterium]|nr:hypothetical protein [Pirellulales bacterium]